MDLSRFVLPFTLHCPLGWTQNDANILYHCDMLRKAAASNDAVERMEIVTAFIVSSQSWYASDHMRWQHLNGIVGETFELTRPDLGFRSLYEIASFQPHFSAKYAESVDEKGKPDNVYNISVYGCTSSTRFEGKTVVISWSPDSTTTIHLPGRNETYVADFSETKLVLSNFLRGISNITFRLEGSINVSCIVEKPGESLKKTTESFVEWHLPSKGMDWLGNWDEGKDPIWFDGFIKNPNGDKALALFGRYKKEVLSVEFDIYQNSENWMKLWKKGVSLPKQKQVWEETRNFGDSNFYNMDEFLMQLNCADQIVSLDQLPPTDTRFRSDLQLLERGFISEAEKRHAEIEKCQIEARNRRMNGGDVDPWKPIWFDKVSVIGFENKSVYQPNGKYWNRQWNQCPNLGFK